MLLVTGASGQLGMELKKIYGKDKAIFASKNDLDITDNIKLNHFFENNNIMIIINCAAYTNVDEAENNIELCNKVNITGVQNLAKISKKYKILVLHISTDYVYDGENNLPYKETDNTQPLSVYGKSKLQGELELLTLAHSAIIIRSGWLYSKFNKNFVNTILKLSKNKSELNVINDQIGTPTYAYDLAKVISIIIIKINYDYNKKEIYHFSNEGVASWYDFAYEIIRLSKVNCNINPIASKDYQVLAKRPYYTVLDKSKIKQDFGIKIRHWSDALTECLIS
tara:strand:+ start:5482 stop:6324 length:843 start_codon:yes stop_codon:yes gene_type:complete